MTLCWSSSSCSVFSLAKVACSPLLFFCQEAECASVSSSDAGLGSEHESEAATTGQIFLSASHLLTSSSEHGADRGLLPQRAAPRRPCVAFPLPLQMFLWSPV